MNEGGTAMKYSVMGKVREKVACASQLHLRKILLSRFNLMSGAVFRLRWVVGAVILTLSTSVLFAGCVKAVAYQPVPQEAEFSRKKELDAQEGKRKYQPVPQEAKPSRLTMTAPTALRKIREGLQKGIRGDHGLFGRGCDLRYENINVTFTQLSFTQVEKCENLRYQSPPESELLQFNKLSDWRRINGLGNALGFADAVNAIKYYSSGSDVADDVPIFAKFQEEAGAWRALPVKPALPEAVRRFKILAEDAIQNKNFEEAIDYYEQGLTVSPLWPEGQFNAALLYGELQIYGQAVLHMKRYLELSPDAKDAQAARDKVVIWEEKVRMMSTHGSDDRGDHPLGRPGKIKGRK